MDYIGIMLSIHESYTFRKPCGRVGMATTALSTSFAGAQ